MSSILLTKAQKLKLELEAFRRETVVASGAACLPSPMAEISEEPQPPPAPSQQPQGEPEFDPNTLRKTKPGVKRLVLTVTVLLSFLLGFPFLWKSVEIYRSPLPFADIDDLSIASSFPLLFPFHFHAIFLTSKPDLNPDDLRLSLLSQITKLPSLSPLNFTLSVTVDSAAGCARSLYGDENSESGHLYKCGAIRAVDFADEDEDILDERLNSVLDDCALIDDGKVYSVVVVAEDSGGKGVRAVVGKYRHAWIVAGSELEAEAMVERVADIFLKVFVKGGKEEGLIHGEFMPVGADGRIVLSFNLLNADPRDWIYDWDLQSIEETLLAPMIKALEPIANISVESQVLYHVPKSSFSFWDEKLGSHIFSVQDLPFFVNSNEWHLDTSIAAGGRSKILQFAVYVPSAEECPLLLQLPSGEISATNGFISPMWGGVMVWNPQSCVKDSEIKLPVRNIMSPQDLEKVFEVFMGQFRQLLGLKSDSLLIGASGTCNLLASERGFTEWELDFLSRQHTCFNLQSSATTLGSLSGLVQSLPRMIIMDEIGKQVKFSLEAAKLAQSNASLGVSDASAVSSRQARSLAEDAFFHPSMMSVSYFSFEHCFAVYSPFFLPVSMHVILAAVREWRRYKKEKAKYISWKAKEKVA